MQHGNMQNLSFKTEIFERDGVMCADLTFHLQKRPYEVAMAFRSAERGEICGELVDLWSNAAIDENDDVQMDWLLQGLNDYPKLNYDKKQCRTLISNEKVTIFVRDTLLFNPKSENFRIQLIVPKVHSMYVRVAYDDTLIVEEKINLNKEETSNVHSIPKCSEKLACKTHYTAGNIFWHASGNNEK